MENGSFSHSTSQCFWMQMQNHFKCTVSIPREYFAELVKDAIRPPTNWIDPFIAKLFWNMMFYWRTKLAPVCTDMSSHRCILKTAKTLSESVSSVSRYHFIWSLWHIYLFISLAFFAVCYVEGMPTHQHGPVTHQPITKAIESKLVHEAWRHP